MSTTDADLPRLRTACVNLWLAGRFRDPVRLAERFGLNAETVRQWRGEFAVQYASVRAHLMVCNLTRLRGLPAWERRELTRRVLAERLRRAERERRLRPLRVRTALAVLEAWARAKKNKPRCGARCRDGHACLAPVVLHPDGRLAKRCRRHGGLSTGAKTPEGKARALAALLAGNARWRARQMEFPAADACVHASVVGFGDA